MILSSSKESYNAKDAFSNNVIGKKLKEARIEQGLKQADVVDGLRPMGIDLQVNAYGKWEQGLNMPNAYQLLALCCLLHIKDLYGTFIHNSDIEDEESPLNEEGQRKVKTYIEDLIASGLYLKHSQKKPENKILLRVFDLPASAGVGDYILEDTPFTTIAYPQNEYIEGTDFGIKIDGRSMEPWYCDGQIALVQKTNDLTSGDIGIFIYQGDAYIKQLKIDTHQSEGNADHTLVLHSLNPKYRDIFIDHPEELTVVGKVLN